MDFTIAPVSTALDQELQHKINNKTKPIGSLGLLERVALQIGKIQQTTTPALTNPHLVIFAADHGAAKEGVSAYPQDVTWQMVENYLAGGAGVNVFARQHNVSLKIVDSGIAHEFGPREGLINAKISTAGTKSYITEPAMSLEECEAALAAGAKIIDDIAKTGCNVMGVGEMGIGNTASASLITHALVGTSLAECVGRGTGLDDEGLKRKLALLQKAAGRACLPTNADPIKVLCEFGGFEIAMMAGALLAGAKHKMTLLIDGFIATSALMIATKIAPAVRDYCVFCHRSAEPGAVAQMGALKAEPLIDLGLRLGEGSGVAIAYPLVRSAVLMMNEMASFDSAQVSRSVS